MKGFVRILEAMIASILLLTVLSFFFKIPEINTNWSDSKTSLEMQDAISVLGKFGIIKNSVSNYDATILSRNLTNMLSKSLDFSIDIEGIPNPIILVTCGSCDPVQENDLKTFLDPLQFKYKNRTIEIRITSDDLNNFVTSYDVTLVKPNILFIYASDTNINDLIFRKNVIRRFLSNGGSVIIYGTMNEAQLENPFIIELLNSTYSASAIGTYDFIDLNDVNSASYKINKYYSDASNKTSYDFKNFTAGNLIKDVKTVVGSDVRSVVYANTYVSGKGKALWFSSFHDYDKDIKNLLKASVMWSSEKFNFDCAASGPQQCIPKNPGKSYKELRYIEAGNFYTEPFTLVIKYWTVFQ